MAKSNAVWGIDIGQCALKALRCTNGEDGTVVADKYDYIEYPKILSQPEADPEELVREALEQFLSRNEVRGDSVAISVPGQAGLSRFFKPPPVDAKTLPDIVKYEVKQQIPFPIEDVIWDWQQLGGSIVDGRTVDAEVGLFAMKREAVYRALKPFDDADVEVDVIQLSPLAIYNVVTHDILQEIPNPEDIDPENPPESVVVMSMGTDTTDLIVTNGIKLWLRNIPIGGNHFTKQLSRDLKLTQAKAEQLKRNAAKAEDPKAVFKAMRPVFSDLINEVQRSLTFFQSMDKTAVISHMVLLGNAAKLPGLRTFLNKQLEIDIAKITEFENLRGNEVISQKSFANNILSLAPCYGLCLQGLKQARLKTDLLPTEIKTERIIRAKKPWVLASVGALMLGLLLGYMFKQNANWAVSDDYSKDGVTWLKAKNDVNTQKGASTQRINTDASQKALLEQVNLLNAELTSASEDKATWIEILKAIYEAMPKDERLAGLDAVNPNEVPFEDRKEIYVDHMETAYYPDLSTWSDNIRPIYDYQFRSEVETASARELFKKLNEEAAMADAINTEDPLKETPGWIIELKCHHYHNGEQNFIDGTWGKTYVMDTLIDKLLTGTVTFPGEENEIEGGGEYKFSDFGISLPTIVQADSTRKKEFIGFGGTASSSDRESRGEEGEGDEEQTNEGGSNSFEAYNYEFTVQMAWIPRSPKERFEAKQARLEAEAEAAKQAALQNTGDDN